MTSLLVFSTDLRRAQSRLHYPRLLSEIALLVAVATFFVFTSSARCFASRTASITGDVTDPTGAAVAGARVILRELSGALAREKQTLADGSFVINGISPGEYKLLIEAPGFSQPHPLTVKLVEGENEKLTIQLEVAAVTDRLVITATRTELPLSETQGSVSLVSGNEIERLHLTLVSESLREIPGLTIVQTGGRGGLTSLFSRGGESDYNKVLIDGVPVNAAGGAFDFSALTTENLARIEVARGPGSALFGSDAMTSVVQLITRRGTTEIPEFEFTGEGGSFDSHRETARLSGLAKRFDYSSSFGFQSLDGRFQNSDFINRSISNNFGFKLGPDAGLRITTRWNDSTLGVPGPTSFLFADPDERQKHRDLALSSAIDWRLSPRWYQSARFIFSEFNTHSFDPVAQDLTQPDRPPLPPGTFGDDFQFTFRDHEKRIGFHYQAIVAVGRTNVLSAGADYEHESAVFTDDFSRVAPERNNLGLFIQDQVSWRERLFLTAGVRVERNRGEVPKALIVTLNDLGSTTPVGDVGFGLSANPKIAGSVLLRGHREQRAFGSLRLKGSFGTGIKEPRLDEAFSPSPFFLGNPALDPERAISFDAGVVQEFFGRRANIEATYFDSHFRDLIVFESDPLTFGPIKLPDGRLTNFVNLERAHARGLELIGFGNISPHLRLGGSYSLVASRLDRTLPGSSDEVGLPLLRRPRHFGALQVSWIAPRFDVSIDSSFVGRRRDFDPVTFARFDIVGRPFFAGGYAKVNLATSYNLNRNASAFMRIENLLNRTYEEILGFPAYRLNFTAGLRIKLGGGK